MARREVNNIGRKDTMSTEKHTELLHAISNSQFRRVMEGFRDGVSRKPIVQHDNVEFQKWYEVGYLDGQKISRAYSDKLCETIGLQNPVIGATKL